MSDQTGPKAIVDLLNASAARSVVINDILEKAKVSGKISPADIAKILPREALSNRGGLQAIIRGIGEYLKREKVEIKNLPPQEISNGTEENVPKVNGKELKSSGRKLVSAAPKVHRILKKSDESEFEDILNEEEEREVEVVHLFDSLNSYLAKVAKYRLLTAGEEAELARRIQEEGDLDARNELVLHNIRWVASIANRFLWSNLPVEDLVQEGTLGLMTAAEKFDHKQGFRFTTYATLWIRQAIGRAIANKASLIRIPVHIRETMTKIRSHLRKSGREGELPPASVLTKELGLPIDKVKDAMDCFLIETRSLHDEVYKNDQGDEGITLEDALIDEDLPTPEFALQIKEELEASVQFVNLVLEAVKRVRKNNTRDCEIFKLMYGFDEEGEPWTLEMVGHKLGVTRERIRQILEDIHEDLFKEGIKLSREKLRLYRWRVHELQKMANVLVQF